MPTLSTHVLDTSTGNPAQAVRVDLLDAGGALLATADTNEDGRVKDWSPDLGLGFYTIIFHTAEYFQARGQAVFYPKIAVEFAVDDDRHYHVPLLLSPYGYSTYRGS